MASTSRSSSRPDRAPTSPLAAIHRYLVGLAAVVGAGWLFVVLAVVFRDGQSALRSIHDLAGLGLLTLLTIGLGFLAVFLRDPERAPGSDIVSAADGRVQRVEREGARWRVAVFMNVTDVHVNRFPMDATVVSIEDAGSGHRPAFVPDASHNAQRRYLLATPLGEVELIQMTGALARRLVSWVRPGEHHAKGDRLGMIALGSRVDLLLPAHLVVPCVRRGDRVRAGRTTVARETP
jgi:phosphatidylserine decarboxylase